MFTYVINYVSFKLVYDGILRTTVSASLKYLKKYFNLRLLHRIPASSKSSFCLIISAIHKSPTSMPYAKVNERHSLLIFFSE